MHESESEFEKLRKQFNILRKSLEENRILDLQVLKEIRHNIFLCDRLVLTSENNFKSLLLLTYRYWLMCYDFYIKSSCADSNIDNYKPPLAMTVPQHDIPPEKALTGLTEADKTLLRSLRINPDL